MTRAHFALSAILICRLVRIDDPQTHKSVWLPSCGVDGEPKSMHFLKTEKTMKRGLKAVKKWMDAQRPEPKQTVSVNELKAGK